MLTKDLRLQIIRNYRRKAKKDDCWPMSESEALTKALARIRRYERAGGVFDSANCFTAAIQRELSHVVNSHRYW